MATLTPLKTRVMTHYVENASEYVLSFDHVKRAVNLTRPMAKRIVRQLAGDGLLELGTGFDDEGRIAGRGYMLTDKGRTWGKDQGLTLGGFFV